MNQTEVSITKRPRGRPKKIKEIKTEEPVKETVKAEVTTVVKTEIRKKPVGEQKIIWTSGRRKTAVARIKFAAGSGLFQVNEKPAGHYFPTKLEQDRLFSPFQTVGRREQEFDVSIKAAGGGKNAQLAACVHGLARALVEHDETLRSLLKKKGMLTRDPRMRERKKVGLRRARRAPQFAKR